jgi:hypothetical protein
MVGETYQLKEKYSKLPKGLKVRLMAIVTTDSNVSICVINYSNGSEWRHSHACRFISIESSEDLNLNTLVTFIPSSYLEPVDDFNKIIIWNLAHKWNVRESDHYTKFRKEFLDNNGYDIHENIYKNRR